MSRALLAGWLAVVGVAHAAPPADGLSEAERVDAALIQVRLWIDMGELGKAEALARRGVAKLPDDARWHRARLDALHAAGMDPWIEAEYVRTRPPPAGAAAHAIWEVEVGRRLGFPPELAGPGVDVARASLALQRGDLASAAKEAERGDDTEHLALRARLAAATGSEHAMLALLDAWPDDAPRALLAPVLSACAATKGKKACAERLAAIRAAVSASSDVLGLMDAADLGVALGDAPLLAAVDARLDALKVPKGVQAELDGFTAGPAGWLAWETPPRPRLPAAELDALGAGLAARGETKVPWGRPDERRRVAVALAEALQQQKEVLKADQVLVDVLGPCTPSVRADVLVASGQAHEGRELAVERLLACVGGTDLVPDEDPAGLEVDARLDDLADAWLRFGRTAEIGRWHDDAALAFAIAARLSPDPDVVALARSRAKAVGWKVDGTGLPTAADLVARLEQVVWLRPAQVLLATRADRLRARTIAWLDPTPEHLAVRVTPEPLCIAPIRSRCALERAVAVRAFERARRPVPPELGKAEGGPRLAADALLDRLEAVRFQRRAELSRLVAAEVPRDLSGILAGGVRPGYRAPRWTSGGVRSADLDGRVVVLLFWASWARPSLPELLVLDGMASGWDRDDLPVRAYGVNVDESDAAYRKALARVEVQSTALLHDASLRDVFAVETVPTIVVVDGTGVLRDVRTGYDDGDLASLDAAVRAWAALAGGAAAAE